MNAFPVHILRFAVMLIASAANGQTSPSGGSPQITAPVTSGFGLYAPYTTPEYVPVCGLTESEPAMDFSNVAVASKKIQWNTEFTPAEQGLLRQYGMLARPESLGSFAQAYLATPGGGRVARYISLDAVLHGLRVTLDEAYRQAEYDRLIPMFSGLLEELSARLQSILKGETNPRLSDGEGVALAIVQTAQRLIDSGFHADPRVREVVEAEAERITKAAGTSSSVVLDRQLDYSLFAPMGYYRQDTRLAAYYRAMTWLAVGLTIRRPAESPSSPAELRAAIIMARTMDMMISEAEFARYYRTLNETIAFFNGGRGDAVTVEMLASLIRGYYGKLITATLSPIADDQSLKQFAAYLDRLLPVTTRRPDGTRRFTVFPSLAADRFTVLDRLCGTDDSFADLLAASAPGPADGILTGPRQSGRAKAVLQTLMSSPPEEWVRNLEQTLLYTLLPLTSNSPRGEGYPRLMRSASWRDRELLSAMGSAGAFGRGMRPAHLSAYRSRDTSTRTESGEMKPAGYAEPNPEAWSRIASLAAYFRSGFGETADGTLVSKEILKKFRDIERASSDMMLIAVAELTGKPCTPAQLRTIADMPARIAAYETPTYRLLVTPDGRPFVSIAGEPQLSDNRLNASAGQPLAFYAIVPRNDGIPGLMLVRGAVFGPRSGTRKESALMATYLSPDYPVEPDPVKFRSIGTPLPSPDSTRSRAAAMPSRLSFESPIVRRAMGELWFTLSVPNMDGMDVTAVVINESGQMVLKGHQMPVQDGQCFDLMRVEMLPAGHYILRLGDGSGLLLASGQFFVVQ